MKAVQADFVRRRAVSRWWWGMVVAAVAVAGALAWDSAASFRAAAALRAELVAQAESSKAARDALATPLPQAPKPYDLSARDMLLQHGTPWPQLLNALEAVQLPGVRVTNLDYAAAEHQARVDIAVAQQALALQYAVALNDGLPASGLAWRWSVLRIEQGRSDGVARAILLARWVAQ